MGPLSTVCRRPFVFRKRLGCSVKIRPFSRLPQNSPAYHPASLSCSCIFLSIKSSNFPWAAMSRGSAAYQHRRLSSHAPSAFMLDIYFSVRVSLGRRTRLQPTFSAVDDFCVSKKEIILESLKSNAFGNLVLCSSRISDSMPRDSRKYRLGWSPTIGSRHEISMPWFGTPKKSAPYVALRLALSWLLPSCI